MKEVTRTWVYRKKTQNQKWSAAEHQHWKDSLAKNFSSRTSRSQILSTNYELRSKSLPQTPQDSTTVCWTLLKALNISSATAQVENPSNIIRFIVEQEVINTINRSLYITWLLEEITNNSNKYCIFGLTLETKSEYTVFIGIICYLFQ